MGYRSTAYFRTLFTWGRSSRLTGALARLKSRPNLNFIDKRSRESLQRR